MGASSNTRVRGRAIDRSIDRARACDRGRARVRDVRRRRARGFACGEFYVAVGPSRVARRGGDDGVGKGARARPIVVRFENLSRECVDKCVDKCVHACVTWAWTDPMRRALCDSRCNSALARRRASKLARRCAPPCDSPSTPPRYVSRARASSSRPGRRGSVDRDIDRRSS